MRAKNIKKIYIAKEAFTHTHTNTTREREGAFVLTSRITLYIKGLDFASKTQAE